ncbi:MAG: hypothetical protein K0Q68_1078 [Moraxellaceae bacterium]|jgi:hypothetical protein|nr:hypothetical protein [Moraxellaceae bacterium]
MSFAAQEQVLLDLLFDRDRRAAFRRDPQAALAAYALEAGEIADFAVLRIEALEMDAAARVNFILAQYCRSYPLAFSLVSSLPEGLDLLRGLVDAGLIRTTPGDRVSTFGLRLRDRLQEAEGPASARERALLLSIVEAELGMASTAQLARAAALAGGLPETPAALPADWLRRPLQLAPLTSAAVLPRPYAALKEALCTTTGAGLWRHLGRHPLTAEARQAALAQPDLRLLVARAAVIRYSPCEPEVEHVTVELGEGFARLLPHVDGRNSVTSLLDQLRAAGAAEALVAGVLAAFRELGRQGMVQVGA